MANKTNTTKGNKSSSGLVEQTAETAPKFRRWEDEEGAWPSTFKALSREEAQALRTSEPPLNPWRVILAQAVVGGVVALLAALVTGKVEVGWSALYGAACVVVPGALLARGVTSPLASASPALGAVSVMLWEMVKIVVSVAMLMAAPKLVQPLSWPALLVGLVLCMKVYWFALLWRVRSNAANKVTR